jgi:glutathionylspermidine synthase
MFGASVQTIGGGDPLQVPSLLRELTRGYLLWDPFVAGKRRVDLHPLVLPARLHEAAVVAAESVARSVGGVAARAHEDASERRRYGLHPNVELLAAASHAAGDDASLMRVDLLLSETGEWKACEINADCPGGHNEALGLPSLARAAGFLAGQNPTRVVEALVDRLASLADGGTVALLFATAYAEDLQVCALVKKKLEQRKVRAILAPATAPREVGGELFVGPERVSVLYRYFPAEYMESQGNVGALAGLIARGRVRTLTGFSHIYAQSKYAFARAFASSPSGPLPPTFDVLDVPLETLIAEREDWVVKRAFGRVGDEVFVGPLIPPEKWAHLVADVVRARESESWIAQRFVRQATVPTPWGPRYVTLGAYLLDGRFVGYFARVTPESHVSHGALVLPVFHLRSE